MDGNSLWPRYLAVGVLSLGKAAALRGNRRRMFDELLDAGLFLGLAGLIRWVEGDREPASTGSKWAARLSERAERVDPDRIVRQVEQLGRQEELWERLEAAVQRRREGDRAGVNGGGLGERIRLRS